ncbi:MAG: HD domain-containing protein [Clostridia bacterium]|nr:HD domain-containing protein [Clostridia bacterium]
MAIRALDLIREEMCVEKGFKRDNGTDYYNHCVDVANTLISFGITDEDVICAALLHDIIEDVEGYRRITIARMFNENIARLVMLVTKEEGVDYKQPEKIKEYLEGITTDMNAAAIKTADRMHNMMTLEEKTFEARYKKAMETKTYYLPFFKESRYRYPRYENLFYAARAEIEPLIFHIESFYKEIMRLNAEIEQLKGGKTSEQNGELE